MIGIGITVGPRGADPSSVSPPPPPVTPSVPANAILWPDGSAVLWPDGNYVLWS